MKTPIDDDGDGVLACDVWGGADTPPQQEIVFLPPSPSLWLRELLEAPLLAPPISCMASISHLSTMLGAIAGCYPTLNGDIC